MVEGLGEGEPGPGQKSKRAVVDSSGGRLRFTVELRPGETTIVSWKKLLREVNPKKTTGPGPSVLVPSSEAHPLRVSQPPPLMPSSLKPLSETEVNDNQAQAAPNRLSNVIERIERMYAGNGSSDEEDVVLDDVPDDDEYDTEDSFIDDTELDDYFQVDNSAIKHDGFFVNRGKLERIEPTTVTEQQPKKRRRKDMTKSNGVSDDGHHPKKHVKTGNKGKKIPSSVERNSTSQVAEPNDHSEDVQHQPSPVNAPESSLKKKSLHTKITGDSSGSPNSELSGQDKGTEQQRTGGLSSKNHGSKKESSELQGTSSQRSYDKGSYLNKTHIGKQQTNSSELDPSIERKGKSKLVEGFDLNVPACRDSLASTKTPLIQRKDGSIARPKSSMLEKAIRELQKKVAESRPTEVQDPDNSSQAIKRRLTPEIKQNLAKVARYAQASYGKIPKDVISRLVGIVGHMMQLRTLKRNLRVMANMGLTAKQEKDDREQKIKQEVAEMVKLQIQDMKLKLEEQTPNTDDFQEADPETKEALKRRYIMDDALENKICDLYDLYVERLEENSGPPIRRLYEELLVLWPSGVVDTDGIKRAIHRAKDRRRELLKEQEKIKKTKVVTSKPEDITKGEATTVTKSSTLSSKSISDATPNVPVVSADGPTMEKPKQEKAKGSLSTNPINAIPINALGKKKMKRKAHVETSESQFRLEKVAAVKQSDEKKKQHKIVAVPVPKPNLEPNNVFSVSEKLN